MRNKTIVAGEDIMSIFSEQNRLEIDFDFPFVGSCSLKWSFEKKYGIPIYTSSTS